MIGKSKFEPRGIERLHVIDKQKVKVFIEKIGWRKSTTVGVNYGAPSFSILLLRKNGVALELKMRIVYK